MKQILVIGLLVAFNVCFGKKHDEFFYDVAKALECDHVVYVAAIGAGPAGLAAGLYATRGGFPATIFSGGKPGGQLLGSKLVENVVGFSAQSGKDIMKAKVNHVASFGVPIVPELVTSVDFTVWPYILRMDSGHEVRALSVVIATGSTPRLLGIPGELTYMGHGVSTCADCDAHFFQDEEVVVVGGGDSAIIYSLILSAFAKKVTILNRSSKLRATPTVKKHLSEYDTIHILMNKKVVEIKGDDEQLTHVIIEDTQTGEQLRLEVQGLFLAIGNTPNSVLFTNKVDMNQAGYIALTDRSQHTSLPGVFAAGEVTIDVYRQLEVAESDGAKAGMDAVAFLHEIGVTEKIKPSLKLYHYQPEEELSHEDMQTDSEVTCVLEGNTDISIT